MADFQTGTIELTEEERDLLDQIELDARTLKHEDYRRNGELACKLMNFLLTRDGIPETRIRYFIEPEFNVGGRGSSRKAIFEKNGTKGDDIYRHAHFLNYMRYFIHGANLPDRVINDFCREVKACGQVTSGDIGPLGKFARRQARSERLDPHTAHEEFYKLVLDCGLSERVARSIRDNVMRAR